LVRDILCRDTPELLIPGVPNATAALLACLVDLAVNFGLAWPEPTGQVLGIAVCMSLRLLALHHDWHIPMPPDLSPRTRRTRPG
jgi:uncharacterized membrane protein YeiH